MRIGSNRGTSDESSDDAGGDRDVDESSPTSKMTGVTRPLRTPGGSASKKWPSPASVVKSASRAENRAAAEFIAAAEEAARRSASTTPGKGGRGGSAVQSPAQRREERKKSRAEAEAAMKRSPYSPYPGGSLITGGVSHRKRLLQPGDAGEELDAGAGFTEPQQQTKGCALVLRGSIHSMLSIARQRRR